MFYFVLYSLNRTFVTHFCIRIFLGVYYIMKTFRIFVVALFCVFAGTVSVVGETITKTYRFSEGTAGSSTTFQGYFYEEGKPNAHYVCFPNPWTYGSTGSIHATLYDGITVNFASSNNQIFVEGSSALAVAGNATLTVGGGTNNYYIWHVTLYKTNDSTPIDDTNWGADVESTHSFSKTISAGFFNKLVVTYSTEDIYLIDESTTTISGIEDEYAYTGSSIEPDPVVECNGRTLTSGTHYFVGYVNCTNPGTATVRVEGRSPFHGSASKDFEIYDPASIPLEWTAGSTIEVTEDYGIQNPISVTGTGNVTLVIADGVTLTAKCGITIADGATLTVEGPGTLKVTYNTRGTTGEDGSTGGDGGTGFAGISGSLIVNGGTVNVTGGDGGFGGTGGIGGTGGTGGAGICGSLTVNGGIVSVYGGKGGNGGTDGYGNIGGKGGDGGDGGVGISGSLIVNGGTVKVDGGPGGDAGTGKYGDGYYGYEGEVLGGTVTCTADGYVIQESSNNSTWYNLTSGSICKGIYLRVLSPVPITLYDGTSNASAIADVVDDGNCYSVTLSGRTLYKDGSWNTLCLPFGVALAGSPLEGAVVKKMLNTSNLDGNTLTLNFSDNQTTIRAGVPYIVKWEKPEGYDDNPGNFDIQNPVFVGMTFTNADPESEKAVGYNKTVEFIGNYSPKTLEAGEGIYYLGSGNKLYTPSSERTMNSFRACFHVDLSTAQNIKRITLNFGDETITEVIEVRGQMEDVRSAKGWYTLQGFRLEAEPTAPGIYIKDGIKVMK